MLAGREPKTFNRLLGMYSEIGFVVVACCIGVLSSLVVELEKTKNKTAEIQAQLEAQEKKRAEKGVVDDESS